MDINTLVKLTSKAWCLQILAAMDSGVPGRQAALLQVTKANRSSFPSSVRHLIDIGLIERNPGYGHPLRPEFRITDEGRAASRFASRVVQSVSPDNLPLLRKAWTVPVLALVEEPVRFSTLRTQLPMITDRALSQSLRSLEDQRWVQRDLNFSARTPFPIYTAINEGAVIAHTFHNAA